MYEISEEALDLLLFYEKDDRSQPRSSCQQVSRVYNIKAG
jgi:hypothetical protein